jgi:hypothetical protein
MAQAPETLERELVRDLASLGYLAEHPAKAVNRTRDARAD